MGEVNFNASAAAELIFTRVANGVQVHAEKIAAMARQNAPVRRRFGRVPKKKSRRKREMNHEQLQLTMKPTGVAYSTLLRANSINSINEVSQRTRHMIATNRSEPLAANARGTAKPFTFKLSPPRGVTLNSQSRYNIRHGLGVIYHEGSGYFYGGFLRDHIVVKPNIEAHSITVKVHSEASYSYYVEFGTAKHGAAQEFFMPAWVQYRSPSSLAATVRGAK